MPDVLDQSQALDTEALDALEYGICILDADLRIAYANTPFSRLMRYPETLCRRGTPLIDFVIFDCRRGVHGPDTPTAVMDSILAGMSAQDSVSFEMNIPPDSTLRMTRRHMSDGRFVYSVSDVTPVRLVMQEMERNAAVIRHVSDSVAIANFSGRIHYRNQAFTRLFGGGEDSLGMQMMPPMGVRKSEDRAEFMERLETSIAETGHLDFTFSFCGKGATDSITIHAIILPYRNTDSAFSGYLAIYKDITDYQSTLKRLERQTRVLDQLVDAVLVGSPDGYVIDANPATERIYGYSLAELGQKRLLEMIGRNLDGQSLVPDAFYGNLRNGHGWHGKLEAVTKDRRNLVVDCNVQPFYDDDGRLEGFIGIHRDMTERLRAQEALQRQSLIIEHMSEAAVVTDPSGNVEEFNASAARMFGIQRGQSLSSELREKLEIIARGVREDGRFEGIYVFQNGDGEDTEAYFDSLGVPVRDGDGELRHVVSIHRNVTERVRHQREQARLAEQIEKWKHLESLGHLAGQIAHDFNNSLTPILGYARMALDTLDMSAPAYGYLKKVIGGTERAREMTRRILTFGQKAPVNLRLMPLDKTLDDSLDLLEGALPDSVCLERHLECDSLFLSLDSTLIHQLVMNLGTNAAQAMPDGGRLVVSTDRDGDWTRIRREDGLQGRDYARLVFADTGVGVPDDLKEKIFEPLVSTKPSGKGTGLGLAVVLGVVRMHGGAIRMDSAPGKGTSFEIYLPVNPGQAARQPLALPATHSHAEPPSKTAEGAESVWVVDDDPDVAQLVADLMRADGYACRIFAGGRDVLREIATGASPDMMITDISMPDMDGFMLLDALEARRIRLPVVVMSGNITQKIRLKSDFRGFFALIDKPVTAIRLKKTVIKAKNQFCRHYESKGLDK